MAGDKPSGLVCPRCRADTYVVDTRPGDKTVRRRRKCVACDHRFTTYECIDAPDPLLRQITETLDNLEMQIRVAKRLMLS